MVILSAVLITSSLFCDSVWDPKGACEAEGKGLILMLSEEQFAGSGTGKEQTLEERRAWTSPRASDIWVSWLLHHPLWPPEQSYSLVYGSAKYFLIKLLLGCIFACFPQAFLNQTTYHANFCNLSTKSPLIVVPLPLWVTDQWRNPSNFNTLNHQDVAEILKHANSFLACETRISWMEAWRKEEEIVLHTKQCQFSSLLRAEHQRQ